MGHILNAIYLTNEDKFIKIETYTDLFDFLNFNEEKLKLNSLEIIKSVDCIYNKKDFIFNLKEFKIILKKNKILEGWGYKDE